MIKLHQLLSEIYLDGFTSSDNRSGFRRPENFDKYDEGAGWSVYRGGNDWENGSTACAVYIKGGEGEMIRIWFDIKFPKKIEKAVSSSKSSDSPEAKEVRDWGEKASKTWVKEANRIHRESKHKLNPDIPDGRWYYDEWKDCFLKALGSGDMKKFVKEKGVDSTHWKAMKESKPEHPSEPQELPSDEGDKNP